MRTSIPPGEFIERIKNLQKRMAGEGFDLIITFGDEAEPQYVRYFSDYWPSFETAGVFIPQRGEASLLIGPESENFARAWSKLKDIRRLKEYRESSEPEYPGEVLTTFADLFEEVLGADSRRRIGIVGYPLERGNSCRFRWVPVWEAMLRHLEDRSCSEMLLTSLQNSFTSGWRPIGR